MTTLQELTDRVRAYCATYNLDGCTISDPYFVHEQWQSTSFPNAEKPGCYAFFDDCGTLLYIGKASCGSTIGRRAATYFKWGIDKPEELGRTGCAYWTGIPTVLHTIPVEEAHQAPSLEEYLIEHLHPPENRTGRSRKVPDAGATIG